MSEFEQELRELIDKQRDKINSNDELDILLGEGFSYKRLYNNSMVYQLDTYVHLLDLYLQDKGRPGMLICNPEEDIENDNDI